jgi:hypothetical protein
MLSESTWPACQNPRAARMRPNTAAHSPGTVPRPPGLVSAAAGLRPLARAPASTGARRAGSRRSGVGLATAASWECYQPQHKRKIATGAVFVHQPAPVLFPPPSCGETRLCSPFGIYPPVVCRPQCLIGVFFFSKKKYHSEIKPFILV